MPIVFITGAIIYWLLSQPLMIGFLSLFVLIYFGFLSSNIAYGPEHIRKVKIPKAPKEIEELLKTTTFRGELIHVYLISVFENNEQLSQTELVNRVKELNKAQLTHQSIRRYILNLQKNGLIYSPKTAKEYKYSLTKQGLWCRHAIKVCFPKTIFWFIIRHYLGICRLPDYPQNDDCEVS